MDRDLWDWRRTRYNPTVGKFFGRKSCVHSLLSMNATCVQEIYMCDYHAPTLSMLGRKPSFKLLSNRRISSTEVALAMASLTLLASSFVRSRPALPGAITGRGSSAIVTFFAAPVDTVVDNVVAREFMSPSAVKNKPFAACLSLSRILWKSKTLSPGNLQASHSRYHFFP